jgi:hypothetical protein
MAFSEGGRLFRDFDPGRTGSLGVNSSGAERNGTPRNGNGVEKNGKAYDRIESQKVEQGELPADTSLVRDLIKSGEYVNLFAIAFGATVSNYGKDVLFPKNGVRIGVITPEKGTAMMIIPNGEKSDGISLHSWAIRNQGQAIEFISPRSLEDGSVRVVEITEDEVTRRTIKQPATEAEEATVAIADILPTQSKSRTEQRGKVVAAIPRDLPMSGLDPVQQNLAKKMEEVDSDKQKIVNDAIHEFIRKPGKVNEEELRAFELKVKERLEDVVNRAHQE